MIGFRVPGMNMAETQKRANPTDKLMQILGVFTLILGVFLRLFSCNCPKQKCISANIYVFCMSAIRQRKVWLQYLILTLVLAPVDSGDSYKVCC